jgi:hypothetical protein
MGTLRVALIALCALGSGCSLWSTRTLVVHAHADANRDRRFYLVVRTLKEEEFVSDGYQRIAGLVFPAKADPSVRLVHQVAPGRDEEVKVSLPGDQPFAVYALFTEPGEEWKVLLPPPLATRYQVSVEGNRVSVSAPARSALPPAPATSLPETPELALPQAPAAPGLGQ